MQLFAWPEKGGRKKGSGISFFQKIKPWEAVSLSYLPQNRKTGNSTLTPKLEQDQIRVFFMSHWSFNSYYNVLSPNPAAHLQSSSLTLGWFHCNLWSAIRHRPKGMSRITQRARPFVNKSSRIQSLIQNPQMSSAPSHDLSSQVCSLYKKSVLFAQGCHSHHLKDQAGSLQRKRFV